VSHGEAVNQVLTHKLILGLRSGEIDPCVPLHHSGNKGKETLLGLRGKGDPPFLSKALKVASFVDQHLSSIGHALREVFPEVQEGAENPLCKLPYHF
jgi:hypothetical protein